MASWSGCPTECYNNFESIVKIQPFLNQYLMHGRFFYLFSRNFLAEIVYNGLSLSITWQIIVGNIIWTCPSSCSFSVCWKWFIESPFFDLRLSIQKSHCDDWKKYILDWNELAQLQVIAYITSPYSPACIRESIICASFGSQMRNIKHSWESRWQMTAFRLNFSSYGLRGGRANFA